MNELTIEKLRESHQVRVVTFAIRHLFSRPPEDDDEILLWKSRLQSGISLPDLLSEMQAHRNLQHPHQDAPIAANENLLMAKPVLTCHQNRIAEFSVIKVKYGLNAERRSPLEAYFSTQHKSLP